MAGVFTDARAFMKDETASVFRVPGHIDGECVTEIGERAFYGCRGLKRVILPETVNRIGSYAFAECRELEHFIFPKRVCQVGDYAFYNCMALKEISFGAELSAIGYGAFKNCLELSAITMEIAPGKGNGLNSILQDEFQAVDVTIRYLNTDGAAEDEARLIFTDYQYEYVPEIEARQFNWETYGSGDSYRISIGDADIDYAKYDSVFPLAMVEDDAATLFKIAAGRLCWPHRLSEEGRARYVAYVSAHMPDILERIMADREDSDRSARMFGYILDHGLLNEQTFKLALDLAQRYGRPQMTAMLMSARKTEDSGIAKSLRSKFTL